jgi:hypothetical protein
MNHRRKQQQHQPPPLPIILSSDDDDIKVLNEKKPSTIKSGTQWQRHEQLASDMDWSSETTGQMNLEQQPPSLALAAVMSYPSTYDIIDLRTQVKSLDDSDAFIKTKAYVSRTINILNQARLSLLPMFPTSIDNDHPNLLLANVPVQILSIEQLSQRQQQNSDNQSSCTLTIHDHTIPSLMYNYFKMNYQDLMARLNVD